MGKTLIHFFSTFGSKINKFELKKRKKSKNLKVAGNYPYIKFTQYFKYFKWKIKIINFKNLEFCFFWPAILKRRKGQKYFMAIFIVLWPYLWTTNLRSVIRHSLGHSIAIIAVLNFKIPALCVGQYIYWSMPHIYLSIFDIFFPK